MKFLFEYYLLVLCGVAIGIALGICIQKYSRNNTLSDKNLFPNKLLFLLLIIFLCWGYLRSPAFYSKRLWGMLGDNYIYMNIALETPAYYNPQHFVYPWVPGQIVKVMEKVGALRKSDPFFREKAYRLSTWPSRLLIPLSVLFLFWCLLRTGWPPRDACLSAFLMATAQGCWLWGIQGNALGVALAVEIACGSFFMLWQSRPHLWLTMLMGFSVAMGLFAHIATLYFAIGGYIAVLMLIRKRWIDLVFFHVPLFILATAFYAWTAMDVGTWYYQEIFWRLADKSVGGFGRDEWVLAFKNNAVNTLVNLSGFWAPQTIFDFTLITLQIVLLTALATLVFVNWKNTERDITFRREISFPLIVSTVIFVGFLFRSSGTQYFAVATASAVMVLCVVLFRLVNPKLKPMQDCLVLLFLLSRFLYSGFSSESVFVMSRLADYDYLQPKTKTLTGEERYTPDAIANYYAAKLRQK